jgi:hypothetical protein
LASGVSGTEKHEVLERTQIRIAQRRSFIEVNIAPETEKAPVLALGVRRGTGYVDPNPQTDLERNVG